MYQLLPSGIDFAPVLWNMSTNARYMHRDNKSEELEVMTKTGKMPEGPKAPAGANLLLLLEGE